jgi:hypothetical protein
MGDADRIEGSVPDQSPGSSTGETETLALPRVSVPATSEVLDHEPVITKGTDQTTTTANVTMDNSTKGDESETDAGWTFPPEASAVEVAPVYVPVEPVIMEESSSEDEVAPVYAPVAPVYAEAASSVDEVAPIYAAAEPVIAEAASSLDEVAPVYAAAEPVIAEAASSLDEVAPVYAAAEPVIAEAASSLDEVVPVIETAARRRSSGDREALPFPSSSDINERATPDVEALAARAARATTPDIEERSGLAGASPSNPVPAQVLPVALTTAPVVSNTEHQKRPQPRGLLGSPLVLGVGLFAVTLAFALGVSVGRPSQHSKAQAQAQLQAAVDAAKSQALIEAKASLPKPLEVFDLSPPDGTKPISTILQADTASRSRLDAVALGRHWSKIRYDAVTAFTQELKRSPQKISERKVQLEALNYVSDRMVSRVVLETLAEVGHPRALDLLYEIWIGSKVRNDTTQLAEALLLAKDVRHRASTALELALALREKPTSCEDIVRYVEMAIREGDRRAVMPLVTTSQRVNCGSSGDQECIKCLADPKDMRKAIRLAATRGEPVP